MNLPDPRTLHPQAREHLAERIRGLRDFTLPPLDWFNSQPCERHATIDDGAAANPPCRSCGVRMRAHQRVGVAWLYMRGRGLIADQVGTGKSCQAAGLIACCKQNGELDTGRALVCVRPSVLDQWVEELQRFVPKLTVVTATGAKTTRERIYTTDWDICVTGAPILVRDLETLHRLPLALLVVDDIDALRNPSNTTAYAIKRLARRAHRTAVLTATPLQKRLPELHSVLELVGGADVFGSATNFRRTYMQEDLVKVYNKSAGRNVRRRQFVGYRNMDDFKARAASMTLRRTPDDIDDVDLPAFAPPNNVYLPLHPGQKTRYDELRRGVLRIIKDKGVEVRQTTAAAAFTYGAKICAGLATLGDPDGPGASTKLDWIGDKLDGDLAHEKVVIFCHFTATVEALRARLDRAGIGHAEIWGRDGTRTARRDAKSRFWDDPNCRVLIGTTAMEQGLNLQVARHLICVDQILNPARMHQLAGRIRRDGSAFRTVYVHNLLAVGTQEEGYLELLRREQAIADHVWDESSQLYEKLPPLVLLQLIGRSTVRA